jgi:hypothetical protein
VTRAGVLPFRTLYFFTHSLLLSKIKDEVERGIRSGVCNNNNNNSSFVSRERV